MWPVLDSRLRRPIVKSVGQAKLLSAVKLVCAAFETCLEIFFPPVEYGDKAEQAKNVEDC